MFFQLLRFSVPFIVLAPHCALALPQWIPVSKDGAVSADYNSIKKSGSVYSIVVSARTEDSGYAAGYMHIECATWRFAATVGATRTSWEPIAQGSVPESVAYLVCKPTDAS
jgi:hypothetical protein